MFIIFRMRCYRYRSINEQVKVCYSDVSAICNSDPTVDGPGIFFYLHSTTNFVSGAHDGVQQQDLPLMDV